MSEELADIAKKRGIKYFLVSFVDLFGVLRSKLVPAGRIHDIQRDGAGFAGFAAWFDMSPADPDMLVMADPSSLLQLPWRPEVAWVAGDPYMEGEPVDSAPRWVLKRQIERAKTAGYQMKTGVECEFFLVNQDGTAISDPRDTQSKPCYDQSALMRRYDVIAEICDCMVEFGWQPYQNDHEDANGQFEMNWEYDDCLLTADRHGFFKFMTKAIAEKHGLRATFMPKPFANLTGNGCHMHISLWNGGDNLFLEIDDEQGLSSLAYKFLAGVMHNAPALCAFFNPSVNSYKRINAPATLSGASWSPNTITYGGNNRTHMVRIPDAGRFELRLMDGATNPYLAPAAVLAAGLDGIEHDRDPGERLDINMYSEGHKARDARPLPLYLLDAIRLTEKSKMLRQAFGDQVVSSYVKLKQQEWDSYARHITEWERENALDV